MGVHSLPLQSSVLLTTSVEYMMMVKIFLLVLGVAVLATAGVADHLNHGNSHADHDDVNKPSQEVPSPMCSIPPSMVNQLKDEKKYADFTKGGSPFVHYTLSL